MDQQRRPIRTSVWWGRREQPPEPWEVIAQVPELPAEDQDVVVVGAGLTGLVTALLLARAGRPPTVLESRHVAAGTTGHSTAKLSLLQGSTYSGIAAHHGDPAVVAYAEAQRTGQRWLLDFCSDAGVAVEHRDAWTYAVTPKGQDRIAGEARACEAAGLGIEVSTATELPFDVLAALRLPGQAQFDPVSVCEALRREVEALGGTVIERVRLLGLSTGVRHGGRDEPITVRTDAGDLRARRVVLATGTPTLDRGLHFAQLLPQRSYALALRVPEPDRLPQGMYLSVDSPARSLRTAPDDEGELLLVGGNNHVVGRATSTRMAVADLLAWAEDHFPGAEVVHSWAAQDYQSLSRLPVVAELPGTNGQVVLATGFNKWGMANAAAAALVLADGLLGDTAPEPAWASTSGPVPSGRDLLSALGVNGSVAGRLATDWAGRLVPGGLRHRPEEGAGQVRGTLHPTATCTVDGVTHRVSAVCTHLGGILAWNDSDLTWDCPLHGSRFTADGHRLEGPAVHDLHPR